MLDFLQEQDNYDYDYALVPARHYRRFTSCLTADAEQSHPVEGGSRKEIKGVTIA